MKGKSKEPSPSPLLIAYSFKKLQRFLSSNKFSKAYDFFTKNIQSFSKGDKNKLAEMLVNRCYVSLSLQMTKNAIDDAKKAIEIDPYSSPAYFAIGIAHLWNGNEENALSAWRIGLENTKELSFYTLMTSLINSLNFRAHIFNMKFNVIYILDLIEDYANPQFPTDSDIQDAFSELRSTSYESAIDHFSVIIKTNPQCNYAYKGRGVAHCMVGHYEECIKDLTTSLEKMPNNFQIDTVKVRAIAYAAIGNIASALFDLNKYLLIVPDDYEVKIEVAKLNIQRKNYLAAYKIFLSIPENELIKNDDSLLSFAECLYSVGELNNASLILSRIEKLKNHKYHYLAYLINRDLNKLDLAESSILEAVKQVPTFFLNRTAADFFCDIGEVENSIEFYKEALQQCPYDAETHLFYAHALFEIGKLGEAALMLQELTVQNEKFKFRGSLDHFNKMNFGLDLLQVAQSDFYFVQTAIMSIDASVMNLQHGFFSSSIKNLGQFFPTSQYEQSLNRALEKVESNVLEYENENKNEKETQGKNNSQIKQPNEKEVLAEGESQLSNSVNNNNNVNIDDEEINQSKEKITNNIQKIEELKNSLSKFYINSLQSNKTKTTDNANNSNSNTNLDSDVYCDENDLNNQKLEQKIEREMFNYLFWKEYNNEVDKDEMNFNECLDQVIALNGNENENFNEIPSDLASYLNKPISNKSSIESAKSSSNNSSNCNELLFRQINNDFKLPFLTITPEILKMIKDADRLGQRCITQRNEKTFNKRLARSLGFCILRISFMMKTQWFKSVSQDWLNALDEIKSILQFADLRIQLKYNCKDLIPEQRRKSKKKSNSNQLINSNQFCSPSYYLMKNGRISPRFQFAINSVFNLIKMDFPSRKIQSFEDIYQNNQDDYIKETKWNLNSFSLNIPKLILKYNGIYGFDLIIRPSSNAESWNLYNIQFQYYFMELLKNNENSLNNLATFIILIFLKHPLNYYSPEIAHAFFHAFFLASKNVEMEAINEENGEEFIKQMIKPSVDDLTNLLREHYNNKKLDSQCSEESLNYWSSMPSISTLIQLLNVKYE